jgi:acetylornithine/N-succinyldiaminopimelate aminotransferase
VQGEGGLRPASVDFLRGLREVCDEFGLLLFFDEVQCGMGRTGRLFAHEWAGIEPDIVATAKGLGGGFPIGACLAKERVARALTVGSHGSTFGGNPLATAVANAVLDILLADGFLERVRRIAGLLRHRLEDLVRRRPEHFEELRGMGLLLGLKCRQPHTEMIGRLRNVGLLTVGAGENVVRLLPPLIIEEAQVDEALQMLESAAASSKGAAA